MVAMVPIGLAPRGGTTAVSLPQRVEQPARDSRTPNISHDYRKINSAFPGKVRQRQQFDALTLCPNFNVIQAILIHVPFV